MTKDEVFDLAAHIIKGELGLIPEENRFQWKGQASGIVLPPQQSGKKSKKGILTVVERLPDTARYYFSVYVICCPNSLSLNVGRKAMTP